MKNIESRNVVPKARKWHKINNEAPTNSQGIYNADILSGHSIRVFGTMTNHVKGPQDFDKIFKIGDGAEYDSFNLIYTGKIVEIGAKTVTIEAHGCNHRLNLFAFIDKNWDFDADRIAKHNSEESQYI